MLLLTKYRPITMQSVIVKLAASIFVHRVRSQSHDGNRHPQQRGRKSRLGTHEAARVLLSATSIALAKGEPFDSARHDALDKVLEAIHSREFQGSGPSQGAHDQA